MKKICTTRNLLLLFYFGLYLTIGISMLLKQPFGNPPDEYNRFLIPQYIAENGTLPNGYDEAIRIGGYGFSYGFQPILPYMLQGYTMRIVSCFNDSQTALLYTGRGVNLFMGMLMAAVVLLLAQKWFEDKRFQWLFAFLVTFLPQSIFVHTYVNTDSCCMLSIAIMLYGLTLGLKDGFTRKSSIILSLGIILCALSYYNAYGYILSCILLFTAFFLSFREGKIHFDVKPFFRKGLFIAGIVLLGISWWFIRSAILYDGDFLGLTSRNECGALYALPEFHPDTRITWQSRGYSLWEMFIQSDFWTLSTLSFIGIYGPMTITTSIWVYRFYKAVFILGFLSCALIPVYGGFICSVKTLYNDRKYLKVFYHANMFFCIFMPFILSLYYSYSTDYQPQGRYILPALIPVCYYTIRGFEKGWNLKLLERFRKEWMLTAITIMLTLLMTGALLLTVYGYAFPYYEANPIAP